MKYSIDHQNYLDPLFYRRRRRRKEGRVYLRQSSKILSVHS